MGILVNTGFDVGSSNPIDNRTLKDTVDERDILVSEGKVYENLKVYCKDTQTEYRWTGTEWEEVGTGGAVDPSECTKTYTSLSELGLTADATFQDVIDKLPKGGSALLGVKDFTNYQTIFPYEEGNNQFARVHIIKGLEDGSCMYARWFRKDGSKEAIAIFNTNDNTFSGWQMLKNQQVYTALKELGLDTTATINDIIIVMKDGTTFTYKTDVFDYATEYENLRYATVTIIKQSVGRVQIFMTDKDTGNLYIGKLSSDNKVNGWVKIATQKDLDELFQSVSNGKSLVANAITGKGVLTSSTATFATMATNISKIQNVNSVSTYKEETKSSSTSMTSMTSMSFTFSAKVLGVKKIIAPKSGLGSSTPCNVVAAMSDEAISISGRSVTLYVNGPGAWKVTALIEA